MVKVKPPLSVLVFDSGVGGLSIVQALREWMPTLTLSYLADNAGFPYGVWAEQDLIERVYRVLSSVVEQVQPCLIVVACNTASTVALPKLRATLSIPVVGVVPAIKPAAQLSQNKVIGLLGTPGTVSRHYTGQLIAQFAAHCQIIRVGSVELVHLAEQHLRGEIISLDSMATILRPFKEHSALDVIVLACTHFPLLRDFLLETLPKSIQLIDSGQAIAARVKHLLLHHGWTLPEQIAPHQTVFFTQQTDNMMALIPALSQFGFNEIRICAIPV